MTFNPDTACATAIGTAIGALTLGTNLFTGKMREANIANIPYQAVFCLLSGGAAPINYCDASATPKLFSPSVQVMIRSLPGEFATGQALARSVYAALHDLPPSGYVSCRSPASEPFYLGEEKNDCHLWSINFELMIEE